MNIYYILEVMAVSVKSIKNYNKFSNIKVIVHEYSEPKKTSKIDKYIGKQIRAKRLTLNLSQEDLANQLNLSHQQIQKYECARNRITAATLYKLATFFNSDIQEFFPNEFKEMIPIINDKNL
jgi:DNA-binding transcriptional regulator YiaG